MPACDSRTRGYPLNPGSPPVPGAVFQRNVRVGPQALPRSGDGSGVVMVVGPSVGPGTAAQSRYVEHKEE